MQVPKVADGDDISIQRDEFEGCWGKSSGEAKMMLRLSPTADVIWS